jgi:hypothetical protein
MAKPLVFDFGGQEIAFSMSKVDRSKLYGFKELEALDEQGRKCELATLAGDGHTVVGKGGTGIGYLSVDGAWCEKSALRPVDVVGNDIDPVRSSFGTPVPLTEKVTTDDYLNHDVRAIYVMESEDDTSGLVNELKKGAIFRFDYSFRGGLEADAGFLLMGTDGNVFFAVGNPTNLEFVGLQEAAGVAEEDVEGDDEGDLMDFGMI